MKNVKIMVVLAILLVAALFVGGASAVNPTDVNNKKNATPIVEKVDVVAHDTAFAYQTVNVTDGSDPVDALYFYSPTPTPALIATLKADPITGSFNLLEAAVNGHYGVWYAEPYTTALSSKYITIWYPDIALKAELTTDKITGATSGDNIDGKTFNKNTEVSFLIEAPNVGLADISAVKIVFTTPAGGKTTRFGTYKANGTTQIADFKSIVLKNVQTIALDTGVIAGNDATAGVWTAQAEFVSPKGFADNAKKSNTISFTLQSTTLAITAAKDSVVRSNPFTVTIQGDSLKEYRVFIENSAETDVNPTLQENQEGWQYNTDSDDFNNQIGAIFQTDASGKRTIQYNTAGNTEEKTYTIKVQSVADTSDSETVKVKVEKGTVTIAAAGGGSYYIGEEIKLTGINTDSRNVFLFITGPNLDSDGLSLKSSLGSSKRQPARNNTQPVSVNTDNTWEYKWVTSDSALDTGAYTIYATSRLTNGKSSLQVGDAVKLSDSEYATTSVNLKQPFLTAKPSGTTVAKGDKIYVRGTVGGKPTNLMLFIFGPNYFAEHSITVGDDGTYEKKLDIDSSLSSNQYFVVIQHPMYNDTFDVLLKESINSLRYFEIPSIGGGPQSSFFVEGPNRLQGSQAADALTKMIDSPNIDDIYTKLTFTVEEPWIKVNNMGDQAIGTNFTISGTTNLAADDQILIEVMSSSFTATDKTSTSTTSGSSQTAKVIAAAADGAANTWSITVDSSTNWKLDEYTIKVAGIEVDVTTTTNFNLVEKLSGTSKPNATGATASSTTATPATPGFGAFIALAGLGAVALLVLRRD